MTFNNLKESIQDDIDDIVAQITEIKKSCDCLEETDDIIDIWANLEDISYEASKLSNLAESLLMRVKAMEW